MKLNTLLLCLFLCGALSARPYRYSLDPNRAEEILAGISLHGPMSESQWLSLLAGKKDDKYTVENGDTLWGISSRTVGKAELWTKLWAMNPEIGNPHDLYLGQVLAFYRPDSGSAGPQIPLIKLTPNVPGHATDVDNDSIVNLSFKNQYRPAFEVIQESELLGELTGAYTPWEWFTLHSEIYAKLPPDGRAPGTTYTVVRVEDTVRDSVEGRGRLGVLVRLLGTVKTLHTEADQTKVELVAHAGMIKRGDRLIAFREPIKSLATFLPPGDLSASIVQGEISGLSAFNQGHIVLLNRGVSDGMKEGFLFRVVVDEDPYLKSTEEVRPDYKGEVQILSVGVASSIGLILRNKVPLHVGDKLVAAQRFADPAPLPHREVQEILVN